MKLVTMPRNNDLGTCISTVHEQANALHETVAAQVLPEAKGPVTPHLPNSQEVEQTLSMMEAEAEKHNMELLRIHSGLNRERIARLLDLLR
ncbi:MAG: pseudouridine synthase [Desulfovibrio sp.]|nr:pseudouridine synthase [Desulfovibrio sp.]